MRGTEPHRGIISGNIWIQLLRYFFPILLGTLFQQMYNLADTIIVGRLLGTQALAAVGSTGALISMINGFFIGVSSGASVILAQYCGAEDERGIDDTLHTGMSLAIILGVVISAGGAAGAPWLLRVMGTPENCFLDAVVYIRIIFLGAVGSMAYNIGAGLLRAMGDSKGPTQFLMISCCLNVILDILLVAGFHMGVAGAALATILAQTLSACLPLWSLTHMAGPHLRLSGLRICVPVLKRILAVGIPAGLQMVTFDLSNTLIQACINSFGDTVMAAWTAYSRTDAMTWMISGAFGISITTFAGQNYGAGKLKRVRESVRVCLILSTVIIGTVSAAIVLLRVPILGIFTSDPEVVAVGARVISIITPFCICFMPVEVFAGTMRGIGCSLIPTVITGICACFLRLVWLYTVVRVYHTLEVLMVCYPLTWCIAGAVFTAVYFFWFRPRKLLDPPAGAALV